jgi:hypothetical protein
VVKKRGAHIKHRAKAVPGIVAISSTKEYETHLRTSVIAFRGGWAEAAHWLDLVDTHDLVRIAFGLFAQPDASVTAVLDLAHVALENIRDRYEDTGRFGTTGDEYEALKLLADTSLHFWSRHSGALFHAAYLEMRRVRMEEKARMAEGVAA